MEQFTTLEKHILLTIKDILTETECFTSHDLVKDSPKILRGALASLIKKGVVSVDDRPIQNARLFVFGIPIRS